MPGTFTQNPGLAEPLRAYTYDVDSNLLTTDNPAGVTDEIFTYDDMGRLATASGAFGGITYDYDSIGNLLSRDAIGGPDPGVMELFYVNGASPLVERVETTPEGQSMITHDVTHDAMGNILDDGVSRYFWDPRPIMRFHKKGGNSAYYRYSDYTAGGIMCARRAYTVDPVVYYAQMVTLDSPGGQRLSERLWDMNFAVFGGRDLVWLGDRLIATFDINASDPGYVFTDHIGYPLVVMDPSAATTWSAVHEPYGEAVLTGGTVAGDPLLRYPGQWKDDPAFVVTDPPQRNLFANGYRWYNPDWGRYTQPDPLGARLSRTPRDNHLYLYAGANPHRFVDPPGLMAFGIGGSVVNSSDCCIIVSQNNPEGAGQQQDWIPPGGAMIGIFTGIDIDAVYFRDGTALKIPDGDIVWIIDCSDVQTAGNISLIPPNSARPGLFRYRELPDVPSQELEFGGPITPPDGECCDE